MQEGTKMHVMSMLRLVSAGIVPLWLFSTLMWHAFVCGAGHDA